MIRPVNLKDAKNIVDIYNYYIKNTTITFEDTELSVEEMRLRIENLCKKNIYFVYENDGQILGYCYAHHWKERAAYGKTYEISIYLDINVQGKGIGSLLIRRLIEECKKEQCHALIACITAENTSSIKFHQKFGFKQVSSFKEVGFKFGRFLDVNDYELML